MQTILNQTLRDDGHILEKAFEVSRSQTGLEERGKGLEKMRSVAEASKNSRFRIVSGRGEIKYQFGSKIENFTHHFHIGGTLIEWSFPSNVFSAEESDRTSG